MARATRRDRANAHRRPEPHGRSRALRAPLLVCLLACCLQSVELHPVLPCAVALATSGRCRLQCVLHHVSGPSPAAWSCGMMFAQGANGPAFTLPPPPPEHHCLPGSWPGEGGGTLWGGGRS